MTVTIVKDDHCQMINTHLYFGAQLRKCNYGEPQEPFHTFSLSLTCLPQGDSPTSTELTINNIVSADIDNLIRILESLKSSL